MRKLLIVLAVALGAIACAESTHVNDIIAPTSALEMPTTHASEPPYGEERWLGHAGQIWFGVVPQSPCKNVPAWNDHGHNISVEGYDDLTGEFVNWSCQEGTEHSNGSTVGILD